mgnify:CR=1 FL=1
MPDHIRALLRWVAAHDVPARVVLACKGCQFQVRRNTLGVRLDGCVAGMPIDLVAQLLAMGITRIDVLPCPEDTVAAGHTVDTWKGIFPGQVTTMPPSRAMVPRFRRQGDVLDLAAVPLPRRVVLGLGGHDDTVVDLSADSPARTLQALSVLAQEGRATLPDRGPDTDPGSGADAAGVGGAPLANTGLDLVAVGCTACGVCVRACPTASLELRVESGVATLTHATQSCRGTGACLSLCPVQALTSRGAPDVTRVLAEPLAVLAEVETSACERCGAPHPSSEGALCQVCAYRSTHQFGSVVPPGTAPGR